LTYDALTFSGFSILLGSETLAILNGINPAILPPESFLENFSLT
jgi:hypothetical protein